MRSLKPSHREKKRYLLIKGKAKKEDIEQVILDFIGILGFAEASPRIIKQKINSTILAINRKALDKVKASFAMSELEVVKVSGSLKGL